MPASFKLVINNRALENIPEAVRLGLELSGAAFQSEVKRYPPQASGVTYKRTGTLGNTAAYKVEGGGSHYTMDVGGVDYMPYVLNGTSKWVGWPGKLAKAKSEIIRGFTIGLKRVLGK